MDSEISKEEFLKLKERASQLGVKLSQEDFKEASDVFLKLGVCYLKGWGTDKRTKKAFQCFKDSHKRAPTLENMYYLGICFFSGNGTEKDYDRAFYWLEKSSKLGSEKARAVLGTCYAHGYGTTKDPEKALQLYFEAAKGGSARAMNNLGWCFFQGRGALKDLNKALEWFEKSAEKNYSDSFNNLVLAYTEQGAHDKAFYWAQHSAQKGSPSGMFLLGKIYESGKLDSPDDKLALQWYQRAAQKGAAQAVLKLKEDKWSKLFEEDTESSQLFEQLKQKEERIFQKTTNTLLTTPLYHPNITPEEGGKILGKQIQNTGTFLIRPGSQSNTLTSYPFFFFENLV